MEVKFAATGRQISPASTFIDFKKHKERIMEVKFTGARRQISPTCTSIDLVMNISPCTGQSRVYAIIGPNSTRT